MSAAMTATMRPMEYVILQVCLPGRSAENAGVVLLDTTTDIAYVKLRRDWDSFASEEADVLSELENTLEAMARESGGNALLRRIEDMLSNLVLMTDREKTIAADPEARLRRLYRENVNSVGSVSVVQLRAAAGGLSDEQLPGEVIGSIEPPAHVRAVPGMFAARVEGRSMEPLIPDGSLCLFRPASAGSRAGKKLLVEKFGTSDVTAQYTVKVYQSEKRATEDSWEHGKIRMIPLNPEFETWELTPDEFRVAGEFVAVLPPEE
ncbi:MAG: S24 family peptidase [Acidobacteria bacterium]|nr:S24 family peptidase [Acidobacteriota bacterium]